MGGRGVGPGAGDPGPLPPQGPPSIQKSKPPQLGSETPPHTHTQPLRLRAHPPRAPGSVPEKIFYPVQKNRALPPGQRPPLPGAQGPALGRSAPLPRAARLPPDTDCRTMLKAKAGDPPTPVGAGRPGTRPSPTQSWPPPSSLDEPVFPSARPPPPPASGAGGPRLLPCPAPPRGPGCWAAPPVGRTYGHLRLSTQVGGQPGCTPISLNVSNGFQWGGVGTGRGPGEGVQALGAAPRPPTLGRAGEGLLAAPPGVRVAGMGS